MKHLLQSTQVAVIGTGIMGSGIAQLAANGQTNRQVAAAMLISPKTVEANLARVYQKLDIRSRAELGRRMAEKQLRIPTP